MRRGGSINIARSTPIRCRRSGLPVAPNKMARSWLPDQGKWAPWPTRLSVACITSYFYFGDMAELGIKKDTLGMKEIVNRSSVFFEGRDNFFGTTIYQLPSSQLISPLL